MSAERFQNRIDRATAVALGIWLAIQLAALGLSAGRFGLWARAPQAAERSGLAVMLAFQAAAASLLFPHLLRSVWSTLLAVASGWPMAVLASQISGDASGTAPGELYILLWLVALYFWSRLLRTRNAQLLGLSIAALLTIGAPILFYLRQEFRPSETADWRLFGPAAGAISQTTPPHFAGPWIELGVIFCCGASISMLLRRRHMHS